MPKQPVGFARRTKEAFEAMGTHDPNKLYYITDTHELYMGDVKYIPENVATTEDVAAAMTVWESNPEAE